MIRFCIISAITLLTISEINAQVFEKAYGLPGDEAGNWITLTSDGGIAVLSLVYSVGDGMGDIGMIKTDADGNLEWDMAYDTPLQSSFDKPLDAKQTDDGGFVITGYIFNWVTLKTYRYLLKTDATGKNIEWMKKTYAGAYSVETDNDKGFLVTGGRELVKYDQNGNFQWIKRISIDNTPLLWPEFRRTVITDDGGYIMGGKVSDGSNNFGILAKLDTARNIQWMKKYTATGTDIYPLWIDRDTSGNIYLAGNYNNTAYGKGNDLLLMKTDCDGNLLWTKAYGGDINGDEQAWYVEVTSDQQVITAGFAGSFGIYGSYVLKTDKNGNIAFSTAYNGNEIGQVKEAPDGGFYIANGTNVYGQGGDDIYVIKTDPQGFSSDCDVIHPATRDTTLSLTVTDLVWLNVTDTLTVWDIPYDTVHYDVIEEEITCSNPPVANFGVADTQICMNDCIDFTNFSLNDPTTTTWSFPGAVPNSSIDYNPTGICYNAAGYYSVTLDVSNAAGSDSETKTNFIHVIDCGTVPVELYDFRGWYENSHNHLQWSTASEENNDFFRLEHSTDGQNYEPLAKVTGAGNSTVKQNYSYTDRHSAAGINYYRLFQVDFDGTVEFVSETTVNTEKSQGIKINYLAGNQLQVLTDDNMPMRITIYDTRGVRIKQQDIHGNSIMDCSGLANGCYLVRVFHCKEIHTEKIIIR